MQVAVEDQAQLLASLDQIAQGEEIVLTRVGVPVARVVPMQQFDSVPEPRLKGAEREAAIQRLEKLLRKGIPLGGVAPTKEEMHARD